MLSRRRADFPRLHRAMAERKIPVEVVGLGGLLAMPEVSDIVSVLSLLSDGTSNAAAVRLLTGPRWRIGVRDLAALGARAAFLARERPITPEAADELVDVAGAVVADEPAVSGGLGKALQQATASVDPVEVPSLLEAAESPGRASRCSPEALERLAQFVVEIRRLRGLVGQPLVDLVSEVITATGLDVEIEAGDALLAEARMANIHAFLDVDRRVHRPGRGRRPRGVPCVPQGRSGQRGRPRHRRGLRRQHRQADDDPRREGPGVGRRRRTRDWSNRSSRPASRGRAGSPARRCCHMNVAATPTTCRSSAAT